ncbi:MAG: diguanylate cyclase [Gammaproteobacteria bacterium]|nr:diguanylate cyclase [Gammaproteobacteria bacterium]
MSVSIDMNNGTASLLRELRDRDSETGLLTANRLYQSLLAEIARSGRYGNPLACVLVQVRGLDESRQDARLQLANRVAIVMRTTDYAGIWQTDEFLLVLPETDEAGAYRFAGKVEQELVDLVESLDDTDGPNPEISTRLTAWKTGDDAEAILARLETRTHA